MSRCRTERKPDIGSAYGVAGAHRLAIDRYRRIIPTGSSPDMSTDPTRLGPVMLRSFTRQELYDWVWSQPMTKVAAELGKTGTALRKTFRAHDIPFPHHGWWTQRLHGKEASRPPLPPCEPDRPVLIHLGPGPPPPEARMAIRAARFGIKPNERPENPDPVVMEIMARLRKARSDEAGYVKLWNARATSIRVSRPALNRLELLLDQLVIAAQAGGFHFAMHKWGPVFRTDREDVLLRITEDADDFSRRANGLFRIEVEHVDARYRGIEGAAALGLNFSDDPTRKIEAVVDEIAAAVGCVAVAGRETRKGRMF